MTTAIRTKYLQLLCSLPLARDAEQETQLSVAGCGCQLNVELVDEQERHSGFEIVEQDLQCRLVEFAVRNHANEAGFGVRTLHVKLGRKRAWLARRKSRGANCGDFSIRRMRDGASCVMPTT
jgi:hypothetical protein